MLAEDAELPQKRLRRSARKIYETLLEAGFSGSYDAVRRYVGFWKENHRSTTPAKTSIPSNFNKTFNPKLSVVK
jgi:hypothetical protein